MCSTCRAPIDQPSTGRPRLYCSQACRQRSYASRSRRRRRNEWYTPPEVRSRVLAEWSLVLDATATADCAIVSNYLGPDHDDPSGRDALAFDHWAGLAGNGAVWLNPPYVPSNHPAAFLARATATAQAGTSVVALVPASTGAQWWWTHVVEPGAQVEFLRGRLAFTGPHTTPGQTAPWASALVVWQGRQG